MKVAADLTITAKSPVGIARNFFLRSTKISMKINDFNHSRGKVERFPEEYIRLQCGLTAGFSYSYCSETK